MTTGSARLVLLVATLTVGSMAQIADARASRTAVFRPKGFPTIDAAPIDDATLARVVSNQDSDVISSVPEFIERLTTERYDTVVFTHGSAFPIQAWPQIRAFIANGGSLVVFGGAPFHVPVLATGKPGEETYESAPRTPTFARELLIGPCEEIPCDGLTVRPLARMGWLETFQAPKRTWTLTLRLTTKRDFDKEDGSSGPRDAIVRPFIHMVDASGVARGCAFVEVDRIRGTEAGGRWVFVPCDAPLSDDFIRYTIATAKAGAIAFDVRPVAATLSTSEDARVRVTARSPRRRLPLGSAAVEALVSNSSDTRPSSPTRWAGPPLVGDGTVATSELVIPARAFASTEGLYAIDVTTAAFSTVDVSRCAVWVGGVDRAPAAPPLAISRSWIRSGGKPMPIIGTTYMASDVHRKFLFEPNPAVWDRDFAMMKQHGINLVRTGLWTGWTRAMLDSGAIDDGVLRALDAFVLTAARHGIYVCFNLFAFQPPMFGGANPFLDPRALEGQKTLLTLIARRYRDCGWVHYDLINEPSYSPADQLWNNRPIGDEFEKREWRSWLTKAYGGLDESRLRLAWDDASSDVLGLPKVEELAYTPWREGKRPRKALDFVRFTNDAVAGWAAQLRDTLKVAGAGPLVTLGQDEGGTTVRPSQLFYESSVDYTSVHTWWNNDDLLWDGVVTKALGKPSLIQETGMMRLESDRGFPWRTPETAARLLERKFAYAFMAGGCGAVQWAWNINPYMPVENEAVIGFNRPDGTAKPELRVVDSFAAFFEKARTRLDDYEPGEVGLVIPHARHFAGRPRNMDAVKQCVRTLAEHFGVVPEVVSDVAPLPTPAPKWKLAIVPAPEWMHAGLSRIVKQLSDSGTKVLVTGGLDCIDSGLAPQELASLGIRGGHRPVMTREPTSWILSSNVNAIATFDERCSEWLRAADGPPLDKLEGAVWHEPLPLEFAREAMPLRALYAQALRTAGARFSPSIDPVAANVFYTKASALVVVCNEMSRDAVRRVEIAGKAYEIPVGSGRARLVLVDLASGDVIVESAGDAVRKL